MEYKRNKWDYKEGGGVGRIQRRKVQVSGLTETKLKGNGEVSWCGVNDDVWHSAVPDFGFGSWVWRQ